MSKDGIYDDDYYTTVMFNGKYVRQRSSYSKPIKDLLLKDDSIGLDTYKKLFKEQREKLCGELLEW